MMNRRIDIHGTDVEYMDGEEEEDVFFGDSDLANEQMAPSLNATMVNPRRRSAKKFTVPWEALRLPSARGSSTLSLLKGAALDLWAGSKDIRSSPYAYVIPASSWTQYINNMNAADVAAEMSAPVSEFETASLYLFAEEWRDDVTHEAFKRRLIDHPLVNVGQEVAKGQLVFDLILGKITAKGGRPDTKYSEMLRLAMDILNSIRMRYYTYYSVNLLHGHEGAAIYEEFLSRYTPLEANEVAIIQEISQGIQNQGRTYAVNSSNPMADAVTTFNLMMRVVESYNIGDTMTARAGISALLSAPINYKSSAKFALNTDSMGRTNIVMQGKIIAAAFRTNTKAKETFNNAPIRYLIKKDVAEGKDWPEKNTKETFANKRNEYKDSVWIEVNGINDATPKNIIQLAGGDKMFKQSSYDDYLKLGEALTSTERTARQADSERSNQRRPKRGSVRRNPNRGNEQMTLDYLRGRPYARLLNLEQMRAEKARLTPENPYLMFGSNGFYAFGDAYAARLGEPGITDVASYLRAFPTEDAVFSLGNGWLPLGPNGVKTNPVAIGKGQHFFIQLRPKSQFSFNAKQKKMGSTAKGSMTVVGTPGRDTTGFVDLFGGFEKSGYVAWKGTHKDSGSSKAWMVQLPRKYGKGKSRGKGGDTVFKAARVTDKETGKSYRTIKPFTADKKIKAAWDKFVAMYGEPVFADDPKRPNLFRVRRKNRGAYYKRK